MFYFITRVQRFGVWKNAFKDKNTNGDPPVKMLVSYSSKISITRNIQ